MKTSPDLLPSGLESASSQGAASDLNGLPVRARTFGPVGLAFSWVGVALRTGIALVPGLAWLVGQPVEAAEESKGGKPSAEGAAFFESHIRPVLVTECVECHGAEKQKGGLRLDSRAGWEKGGDSGAAIVRGKPEESLLMRSIRHEDPDLKMPEKAPKLEEGVIARFGEWIAMGAPDPRDSTAAAAAAGKSVWADQLALRRGWWSLQPIRTPQVGLPGPGGSGVRRHAVDYFLEEGLRKAGLEANGPASAEVLARRLHFLLNGLPPTAEEVRRFVEAVGKSGENRLAAVRERAEELLGRPAFGEHWARHWMDLMRYAETHGSEGDPAIPGAFLYRDYLIRAFNADVPLDQLIREHLAGDLLKEPRVSAEGLNESRIGPGHFRMVEHGYQPVDTLDDQVKAVDNQMDVVTKAFQALTVTCARCHDHKFDAVSQRDYTALYGIFASVRPAQILVNGPRVSGRREGAGAREEEQKKERELESMKLGIRRALSEVWMADAARFSERVRSWAEPGAARGVVELRRQLEEANRKLAELEWRQVGMGRRGAAMPFAWWTFNQGPEDVLGRVRVELRGNAVVRKGALELDGQQSFLQSELLAKEVGEKTFESWVWLENTAQRGGGVLSLEQVATRAFDSLVFGEKTPGKWLPGSNNFRRTEQPDGSVEEAGSDQRVHLVISYRRDGTIATFRNGRPYGKPYRKQELQLFGPNEARVLVGLRHTGAGNGYFRGRVDEARLYDRALSEEEVAASYEAGPMEGRVEDRLGATASAQELKGLRAQVSKLRAEVELKEKSQGQPDLLKQAQKPEHVLHLAWQAVHLSEEEFRAFWEKYGVSLRPRIQADRAFNRSDVFEEAWDLSGPAGAKWFAEGNDVRRIGCGDFRVQPSGNTVVETLLPAGWAGSSLVPRAGYGGLLTSPEFQLHSKSVSVKFAASNGAMLRVIPDNYPLGNNSSIFAGAVVQRRASEWTRLDTSYRVGTSAYVEVTTPGFQTKAAMPAKSQAAFLPEMASFVVERVVFHEGNEPPRPEHLGWEWVQSRLKGGSRETVLRELGAALMEAVKAWREGKLEEGQREWLVAAVEAGLLTNSVEASEALSRGVSEFRAAVARLEVPVVAPGVVEHRAMDAVFRPRGDHKKIGATVARGYLEVLGTSKLESAGSGRLELAERMVDASNPLTARVMANRIWYWLFGSGLVATVDNFGRMGEKPSHPELLDYLAVELRGKGWSLKRMLLELVETDVFQRGASPSALAGEKDPANRLWSHAQVRRLEAESVRDALLSVSGVLDRKLYGAAVEASAPRRSVYVAQRRGALPAMLTTFDAPKPFTTMGRRDVTTVPAQSLTLLNDPAIFRLAEAWAKAAVSKGATFEERVDWMFREALGRGASVQELEGAKRLLEASGAGEDLRPLAHALFNLKEFLYLR
jgi:cytochrome c553